jgi:methionyl-tRNA formyltransferase
MVCAGVCDVLRPFLAGGDLPPAFDQAWPGGAYHASTDPPLNRIDWTEPRRRVRDVVRALTPPMPGAHTLVAGRELVIAAVSEAEQHGETPQAPGTVEIGRDGPRVWAADGPLRIDAFRMDGEEWPGSAFPVADGEVLA